MWHLQKGILRGQCVKGREGQELRAASKLVVGPGALTPFYLILQKASKIAESRGGNHWAPAHLRGNHRLRDCPKATHTSGATTHPLPTACKWLDKRLCSVTGLEGQFYNSTIGIDLRLFSRQML